MLPQRYKDEIEKSIAELWKVWRSLGLYSDGEYVPMAPEEAIAGLIVLGRYDQRLFDEALSFILSNSLLLSKNRLVSIVQKMDDDSKKVFRAIAYILAEKRKDVRFKSFVESSKKMESTNLFESIDGTTIFIGKERDALFQKVGFIRNKFYESSKNRNLKFVSDHNPWIKAKLIFGNSVKVDTIMDLIINKNCTAPMISQNTGYTQKSVWNVLNDFDNAGIINQKKVSNKIYYSFNSIGNKFFLDFKVKKKIPDVNEWVILGHYLCALKKLKNNVSQLLIKSEEKRVSKLIDEMKIYRKTDYL